MSPDGSTFTAIHCCSGDAAGVAVDQSDNVWVAVYSTNSVALVSSSGRVLSGPGKDAADWAGAGAVNGPPKNLGLRGNNLSGYSLYDSFEHRLDRRISTVGA